MNRRLERTIKLITPPIIVLAARRFRKSQKRNCLHEWEYVPEGWKRMQTDSKIKGWNTSSVLEAYKARWPGFLEDIQSVPPFGSSTAGMDLIRHNTILCYAFALALSTRDRSSISMLDWGGGIGQYYLMSQALMPNLEIDYHCKDLPMLAEHGQTLFPGAHFYEDERCLARKYDFVLASTSLHYSEDWIRTLQALAKATEGALLVTRLPITPKAPSYVFVQRPYDYGYDTEYIGWCVNRAEFLAAAAAAGAELIREFIIGETPLIHNAPGPCEYRGFLFRQTHERP